MKFDIANLIELKKFCNTFLSKTWKRDQDSYMNKKQEWNKINLVTLKQKRTNRFKVFTKCHVQCLHQFLYHLNYYKVPLKFINIGICEPLAYRFTWCAMFILFLFSFVNLSFLFVPLQVYCFTTKLFRETLETRTLHFNMEEWLKISLVQFAPPISFHNFHVIKELFYFSIGIRSTET